MTFSFVPDLQGVRALLQRVFIVPIIYLLFSAMPIFLGVWETGDRISDRATDCFRSRDNTFDFIVVGSGSAGAVVANRLSKHFSVLLLEAGGEPHPLQNIPGIALHLISHPQTDWMYRSVPQRKSCLNSVNQQSSWSAGKTLGGTGSLNFMMHLRGHSRDFDNWARITGDNSWGYNNVVPFFKRHEDFHGPTTDPSAKGSGGDLRVEYPDYKGMAQHWLKAGEELNYPSVDFNGRFLEGFSVNQYAIMQGVRQAPYRAFIQPIRRRSNLTIRKFATVNRIIFRDMSNSAYGVEFERHGKTKVAIATKEVIISGGTIGSPKLLMLSGIGPRQHLQELGIPLRVDLPVGQNLQDHLTTYLPFKVNSPNSLFMDRDMTPTALVKWVLNGGGPLSSAGSQASALVSSSYAKSRGEGDWPDIMLTLYGYGGERTFGQDMAQAYNLQEDQMKQYYEPFVGQDSFHIGVTAARPVSKGELTLSSRSPRETPIIDPKYLEDHDDLDFKVMVEGVKLAMHVVENTTAFQKLGATFTTAKLPGCENFIMRSEEYWRCYIRRFSVSNFGASGTVAMGPIDSLNSVVDPELRVINTKGLRVIDSSIMPKGVSTNLQASTMMIGEKGADMILKDWGIREGSTGNGPPKNNPFEMIFGGNGKSLFENFLGIAGGQNGNPLEGLFQMKGNKNFKRDSNRQENITDVSKVVNVPRVFDSNENNTATIPNPLDNLITVIAGGPNAVSLEKHNALDPVQQEIGNPGENPPNIFTGSSGGSNPNPFANIFSAPSANNANQNIFSNLFGIAQSNEKPITNEVHDTGRNSKNTVQNQNPFANIFGGSKSENNKNTVQNQNPFANIFGGSQSENNKNTVQNQNPFANIFGGSQSENNKNTVQNQNPFANIFGGSQSENNKNNDILGNIFGTSRQSNTNHNNNNPLDVLFGKKPTAPASNNENNIFGIFSVNNKNPQKNILESIFTPSTERPKNILETIFSPTTERPKNILETIFSPPTQKPKNILESIFAPPPNNDQNNIFANIFAPPTEKPKNILENIFAPQQSNNQQNNLFGNIFAPTTEKPKNILDNIFAPQPKNNNQNNPFGNIFSSNNNNQQKNIFGSIFGGTQQAQSSPPQNNLFGKLFGNNNNNKNSPFDFLFGSGRTNVQPNPFDVLFKEEQRPASALETLLERITGNTDNDNRNPNLFDVLFASGNVRPFDILFGRKSFFQGFLKGLFNNNNRNNNDLTNNIIPMRSLMPKNPLEGLFGANKNNSGLNVFEIFGK